MAAPSDNNSGAPDVSPPEQPPAKRRRRTIHVCDVCRAKKSRCDSEWPVCSACQRRQTQCQYEGQKSRVNETQQYIDSLKARNRILEQQLAAKSSTVQSFPIPPLPGHRRRSPAISPISLSKPNGPDLLSTSHSTAHRPSQLGLNHAVHAANPPGYQRQRLLSSNISGDEQRMYERPLGDVTHATDTEHRRMRSVEDINYAQRTAESAEQSSEYFGQSSTFDFITRVCSPQEDASTRSVSITRKPSPGSTASSLAISSPSATIFDGFLLGLGNDELFSLPNRFVADRLVDAYFKYTHPLNTYLHEYAFRQRYERLWLSEELGGEEAVENNLAWFGLVNLIFAFGSVHAKMVGHISIGKMRFFNRAKTLVLSSLFQAATIELVQALLLMGQYLNSSLELDNSWTVIGLAIRMAQSLGLHQDITTMGLKVIDQEVRKRVWWGCFVIDRLLSMKVGRPPMIHDSPDITVGLPLAIDDEYLTNDIEGLPVQPPGIPSKFDFLTHVITQCRLLKRICNSLYSGRQVEIFKHDITNIPKLIALTVQLDGDLTAWQQTLPPHLQFDSQSSHWQFERQRSTLLMRFLNSRLLLQRQILLMYVTRECPDRFQRQMMHPCIQRCVMAAHDMISQMQVLSQRNLLHSWWHNSHSVFTALCVMLAFKMLDPQDKAEVGLLDSIDVDQLISQGTELLQSVGEQCHPLASRYLRWFEKLERKLLAPSLERANNSNSDINDTSIIDERPTSDALMESSEGLLEIENLFFNPGWADPTQN